MTDWARECTVAQLWKPNHVIPDCRLVTIYTELRRIQTKFQNIFGLYSNAGIKLKEINVWYLMQLHIIPGRSLWPRGLKRRSTAAWRLRVWGRIPPKARIFVCCECCVLSGRGLCDGLITRPEESSRRSCVWSRNLENEEAKARYGAVKNTITKGCKHKKTNK
jgi:hypothetical protein